MSRSTISTFQLFALVPDAGHACHLERPAEFAAVVLPFLTG